MYINIQLNELLDKLHTELYYGFNSKIVGNNETWKNNSTFWELIDKFTKDCNRSREPK